MMSPSTSESASAGSSNSSKTKVLICPYCGDTQAATERCRSCGGLFEPLSRQASHNAMGPWFVRDERRPFQPGASYETIVKLVERGLINKYSILRGPTTRQFWTVARRVPGIAHLLGYCHNCDASVGKDDHGCPVCGVPFGAYLDRNYLGLPDVKPLPWEAPAIDDEKARSGATQPAFTPMPGAPGGMDFRRAAEPLGLSSFASDAELRGMAARPPYSPPAPGDVAESMGASGVEATEPGAASAALSSAYSGNGGAGGVGIAGTHPVAGSETFAGSRGAILDTSAADIAARSLQRRLQRQQNTIRLLMALMGVVTVASIIVIVIMIVRMGRLSAATIPSQGGQPAAAQGGSGGNANAPQSGGAASPATPRGSGSESKETGTPDIDGPPAELPVAPVTAAPATEPARTPAAVEPGGSGGAIDEDHERALTLLAEAKKEDRPLKDRISDCEQAVALLKGIKAQAAAQERPAGLDEQIVEADRLLERLKLQQFFP